MLDTVAETVATAAREAAEALGYTDHFPSYHPGVSGSYYVYQIKGDKPKVLKSRARSYGHGPSMARIVVYPRGLYLFHPEYLINVFVDSTYATWYVYTEGKISEVEKKLLPLESWKVFKEAWTNDLARRLALTRQKWDTPTSSQSTPDQDQESQSDTSTPILVPKTPTFGDLSLVSKQSRKKR